MAEHDERERRDRWNALGVRTDIAHPARVYDYLLGGRDNFAADRELAEVNLRLLPQTLDSARANRKFQVRAVRFLRERGIRQFLDVGTGLPTSPNTHETAQADCPDARVVYVDNDPMSTLAYSVTLVTPAHGGSLGLRRTDDRPPGHGSISGGSVFHPAAPTGQAVQS